MIVAESRLGRRIVGRLDRGQDLLAALTEVCRAHGVRAAELRATGALETVELAEFDQGRGALKPGRSFGGGLALLSLLGTVSERDGALSISAHATLMRDRDSGVEIVGRRLLGGRVYALEFVLETFDDVILRRGTDAATGLPLWREVIPLPATPAAASPEPAPPPPPPRAPKPAPARVPEPVAAPVHASVDWPDAHAPTPRRPEPPASAAQPTWQQVAAASQREEEDDDDGPEEDNLGPGDIIVHPTFGRCEVQRIEGAYEFAHVRLKNGRLVRLSLDVLKLTPAGRDEKGRVFRARVDG
jgi:uncharacterized protein